ncbi:hypothetical protein MKEN_00217700 [Mycena kentingensis (nom. inval.)]|nr:hypothetical protein MKEN_00217700 [Mycena kentingensis (nom. inval.)]
MQAPLAYLPLPSLSMSRRLERRSFNCPQTDRDGNKINAETSESTGTVTTITCGYGEETCIYNGDGKLLDGVAACLFSGQDECVALAYTTDNPGDIHPNHSFGNAGFIQSEYDLQCSDSRLLVSTLFCNVVSQLSGTSVPASIAGIAVGALLVVLLLLAVIYFSKRRRRQRSRDPEPGGEEHPPSTSANASWLGLGLAAPRHPLASPFTSWGSTESSSIPPPASKRPGGNHPRLGLHAVNPSQPSIASTSTSTSAAARENEALRERVRILEQQMQAQLFASGRWGG